MESSFDFGALLKKNEWKQHKEKPPQFGSVANGVLKRLQISLENRKSKRHTIFDRIRIPECESPQPEPVPCEAQLKIEHRRQQLKRWKEEKEKKKKEETAQKKKPFVVGIPRVPLNFVLPPPVPKPSTTGRVTQSQSAKPKSVQPKSNADSRETQSFAPKNAQFRAPEIKTMSKLPTLAPISNSKNKKPYNVQFEPVIPKPANTVMETRSRTAAINRQTAVESSIKRNKPQTESVPLTTTSEEINDLGTLTLLSQSSKDSSDSCNSDVDFISEEAGVKKTPRKSSSTPKNKKIPKSESSSEEKLRAPKSPIEPPLTPEQMEVAKKISLCVTLSRGKDNARKEMKWKMNESLLDDDTCEGDSIEHFRYQLASETDRMTAKCLEWDKILEQYADQMPDSVQELVLAAVGQARLLMSQKLQQFRSLVDRCAKPDPGSALVTPGDLRGFWDMVFMQVENVNMRFKKLEELQARNWVEDKPVEVKKKAVPKAGAKKTAKPAATSRLRDAIAAARKAKKDQEFQSSMTIVVAPSEPQKTFEGRFFCVPSPFKSPASFTTTPRKENTLLKAVLSNEAKMSASRQSASFAMLRASIFSEKVDCEGVAPLQQTPQMTPTTPGRSILKSNNVASAKKSGKKFLFNESDGDLSSMSLVSEKPDSARDKKPDEKSIVGIELIDEILDSGMPSTDVKETANNKENKAKPKLMKQEAVRESSFTENANDRSPIMTRLRRKSRQTPTQSTKNVEFDVENEVKSTRRSTRKKKSIVEEDVKNKTPRKKSVGKDVEDIEVKTKSKTPRKKSVGKDVEDIEVKTKSKTPRKSKKANTDNTTRQDTEEEEKPTKRST